MSKALPWQLYTPIISTADEELWSASIAEQRQGFGQDRIAILKRRSSLVVLVVDGAGGTGSGAAAADKVCSELECYLDSSWDMWLSIVDRSVCTTAGFAAAVVIEIHNDGSFIGASVGDCEAQIFGNNSVLLTEHQWRKPLLGSGETVPVAFSGHLLDGVLIIGSDGLWKYVNRTRLSDAAKVPTNAEQLINAARLKSGALQDDIAVFLYRGRK